MLRTLIILFFLTFIYISCHYLEKFSPKFILFNQKKEDFSTEIIELKNIIDETIFPEIQWKKPIYQYFENKETIISFPIGSKEKESKIMSFFKNNQNIIPFPYLLIPKKETKLNKKLSEFTGTICFYELDGSLKKAYTLEEGTIINVFKTYKKNHSTTLKNNQEENKKFKRELPLNFKRKKPRNIFDDYNAWAGKVNRHLLYGMDLQKIIEESNEKLRNLASIQYSQLEEEKKIAETSRVNELITQSDLEIQEIFDFFVKNIKKNPWPYPLVIRTFDPQKGFEKLTKWIILLQTYRKNKKFYGDYKGKFEFAYNFFNQYPELVANQFKLSPILGIIPKNLIEIYPHFILNNPKNFQIKTIEIEENMGSLTTLSFNKKNNSLEENKISRKIKTDIRYFVISKKGDFLNLKARIILDYFPYPEVFILDKKGKKIFLTKPIEKKNEDQELELFFGEKIKVVSHLKLKVRLDERGNFLDIHCNRPYHFHDREYFGH